jgi:predicted GIY-YIG superfamily endonuclease
MAKIVRFHPQGHTVYIMEAADGSYYGGMCPDIEKELVRAAQGEIRYFKKPERRPAKVVFKDEHLPFEEAHLKFRYLRTLNRSYRKKMIRTGNWIAGKMLEPLILKKMEKYLEEEASK